MHFFFIELREKFALISYNIGSNIWNSDHNSFLSHVTKKFQDLTKDENLNAMIFYYNQEIRIESSIYNYDQVLKHLTKLIQLLKTKREKLAQQNPQNKLELNFSDYRLGVALQDLSMTKLQIGKPEDASLHLQESEKALLKVEPDAFKGITVLLLRATASRNRDLYRQSQTMI